MSCQIEKNMNTEDHDSNPPVNFWEWWKIFRQKDVEQGGEIDVETKFSAFSQYDQNHRQAGAVVKDIAIGAGGLGFDSLTDQIGHCNQRLATIATFHGRH